MCSGDLWVDVWGLPQSTPGSKKLRRWDVTGRGAVSFAEFTHAVAGCQIVKAPPGQAANSIGVDNQTVLKNANFDLLNMGRNSPKLEKEWRGAMREAEGHITAAEEDLQEARGLPSNTRAVLSTWEILDSVNAGELTAEQGEVFVRLKRVYNFQENWGMEIEQCDKLLELLRNDIELAPSTQVTRAIGVPAPKKGEHKKGAKRIPGLESEMACFSDALLEAELAMLYFKGKDLEAATKHAEAAFECHVREAGEQGAGRIPAAQKVLRLQALLLSQQEKLPEAVRLYQQLLHFQQASKAAGSASAAETSMQLAALLAALCEDVRLEGDARLQYAVDALKAYKCAKKIYGQVMLQPCSRLELIAEGALNPDEGILYNLTAGAKGGNAIVQDIEHRISEVKKAHDMQKRKMDMEKRKAELTKR
eukprot:gene9494-11247_t